MTRRIQRPQRVLSMNQYIHRATLGLPKNQRLDAAAELRTHLMERIAEHQAQGFSHEEAEYLAVKSMGEPAPVNRRLLGHSFTHAAGWLTLAALLLGSGAWYVNREWLPPREGIQYEPATQQDISTLFTLPGAPRGTYQAVTLTYPKGTKSIVYVEVGSTEDRYQPEYVSAFVKDVASEEQQNILGRVPGSYRYQERVLITDTQLVCKKTERAGIFYTGQTVHSRFWNSPNTIQSGPGGYATSPCDDPNVRLHTIKEALRTTPPQVISRSVSPSTTPIRSDSPRAGLHFNTWTVLYRIVVDPAADPNLAPFMQQHFSKQARGVYFALIPLEEKINEHANGSYHWGGGYVQPDSIAKRLPKLPPLVPPDMP